MKRCVHRRDESASARRRIPARVCHRERGRGRGITFRKNPLPPARVHLDPHQSRGETCGRSPALLERTRIYFHVDLSERSRY